MEGTGGGKCDAFSPYTVYMGLGKYLKKRHSNEKALGYYRIACEQAKTGERSAAVLLERSLVNSSLGKTAEAREDVDQALHLKPFNLDNRYANAYILYQENRFEECLLQCHRGAKRRHQPDYFSQGIRYATGTIEDCVGYNSGQWTELNILGKTLLKMKLRELNMIPPDKELTEAQMALKTREFEKKRRYYAEKFLGSVSKQKQFLMDTLDDPVLLLGNERHYKLLRQTMSHAINMVQLKEDALWKRKPLYSFAYQSAHLSDKLKAEQRQQRLDSLQVLDKDLVRQLLLVYGAMNKHQWVRCYELALRVRDRLLLLTESQIPLKKNYLKAVYFMLGEMYLSTKTPMSKWSQNLNDQRTLYMLGVSRDYGIDVELFRESLHSEITDPKKFTRKMLESMKLCENNVEKAFLSHELACYYSLVRKMEEARSYTRMCISESKKACDMFWYLNAVFMLARVDVQDKNLVDAKVALTAIKEAARDFNLPAVVSFIDGALDLLDTDKHEDLQAAMSIAKKEQTLLRIMVDNDLKCKAAKILERMNSLPAEQRMSIIPGVAPQDKDLIAQAKGKTAIKKDVTKLVIDETEESLKARLGKRNTLEINPADFTAMKK